MTTDRAYLKQQQAGQLQASGASDAVGAVASAHSRSRHILKTGAENAATAVAETVGFVVPRKAQANAIKLLPQAAVTQDTANYLKVIVYKRTSAGAAQTVLGSWNTHNSAQGGLTANVPASLSLVNNSDLTIAAGSIITFEVTKTGTGAVLNALSVLDVDLEEV